MITMFAARLLCVLAVLAPVVLALQLTQAAAEAQLAPLQRAPSYERQQTRINAWTRCHRARTSGGGQYMYRCARVQFRAVGSKSIGHSAGADLPSRNGTAKGRLTRLKVILASRVVSKL